ncbi:Uncharacterized membrane protein YccC [Burkholderia sp. WP9]|uniref:FUSC family protein n=1 Tax=Paraburkholderia sp. RL17-383-BIF-A TaxID=3031631 RepID=UPI0008993337|nr:Uncharacterized membrane protein YccC [Burkholderia sp. WP9]
MDLRYSRSPSLSQRNEVSRWLRLARKASSHWALNDGLIWLHLFKTVAAALLALGIGMLLDLQQPRTAMTTVFVLMQPVSGMVLAKSFYRVIGTAVGTVFAILLAGVCVQDPELYLFGLTCWIGLCTAAAVRNRHFRWYGFVLAGYTAALIGVPALMQPNTIFLAALTRAAEVSIGILCSTAVSALVFPIKATTTLFRTLKRRTIEFTDFAAGVLSTASSADMFEKRFAALVDEIVGFEATRTFASYEDPDMRARAARLARLNSDFMNACARLHALHQLLKRLHSSGAAETIAAISPFLDELSVLLVDVGKKLQKGEADMSELLERIKGFQSGLARRARETQREIERVAPRSMLDYVTAMELVHRFAGEFLSYFDIYLSLANSRKHALDRSRVRYEPQTSPYVVGLAFVRTVLAVGAASWFWIASGWPGGSFLVTGAAITCALSSTSPVPPKFTLQIAAGAALSILFGCVFLSHVYPNIDGFPLLCAALLLPLGLGAFLTARRSTAAYGVGFAVFFCLLAGPDNVIDYAPDVLMNNGLAILTSMLLCAIAFAVIFPPQMPWLVEKIKRHLRGQVTMACTAPLPGLDGRFQSSTHDLMSQLRTLLITQSHRHRDALQWMLATLEVGHAAIDLRGELQQANEMSGRTTKPRWLASIDLAVRALPVLFDQPNAKHLRSALATVNVAISTAQIRLEELTPHTAERYRMLRIIGCLHFVRTALLDRDAPFPRD